MFISVTEKTHFLKIVQIVYNVFKYFQQIEIKKKTSQNICRTLKQFMSSVVECKYFDQKNGMQLLDNLSTLFGITAIYQILMYFYVCVFTA